MRRSVLSTDLDADIGRVIVEIGDENLADQIVKRMILVHHRGHLRGEWADEAVGEEDAEECPNEGSTDHLAENFRRAGRWMPSF